MRPTVDQQSALRTFLSSLIGPEQFQKLCSQIQVTLIDDGIVYVFVANADCAAEIEQYYSEDLAIAAEQVFSRPIRGINVLPVDASTCRQ
jgi:hypothetical protein